MLGHLSAILSALVITVMAQDYELNNNRRKIGGFDDDAPELYQDYDYGNQLPPLRSPEPAAALPPPPKRRIVQPPPQKNQYSGGGGQYGGGSSSRYNGLSGKEACSSGAKTVAHETACDLYYDCYEGQGFLQSCPNGLVYTNDGRFGLIGNCDYPHNEKCDGRPERNPPQSTEHCDWLYGIFGHETSCTRYWTCWNGTATEQFCIGGLLYNEETHACDWPQNVAGCQKHPLCKDDANGNVPLGKSCNRYWACQGGYPRLQRCPAMLVFDKKRSRCVTPPTEDCDVPTTNAPQPDEAEETEPTGSGPRSANPRRGGGGGGGPAPANRRGPRPQGQPLPLDGPNVDDLPFNLPPGAVPLNQN